MDKPRWNEKKHVEGAERKKLLGTSPTVFLFNLGPAVRAAALFLHLFTKHERKTHQKEPAGDLPTFCPPCHGPTKTSKVWVQTNIFSHKEVTWSRDQKYLQFSSTPWWLFRSVRLKLLSLASDYNSSFCIPRRNSSESKYQDIAWLSRLEVLEADELSLLPRLLCKR